MTLWRQKTGARDASLFKVFVSFTGILTPISVPVMVPVRTKLQSKVDENQFRCAYSSIGKNARDRIRIRLRIRGRWVEEFFGKNPKIDEVIEGERFMHFIL